ncbi:MAG: hypothetical protein IT559_05985 [Alphaproteobacteria bacterium]|nr:hypothetical protein [Alphaproteobacteria bacterium]
MDYENKTDLTIATSYGPIKTAKISDPFASALKEAIWKNLRELEDILHERKPEKLEKFFRAANKNGDIRNVLVHGDENKPGDQIYTTRLQQIETSIRNKVNAFPNNETLQEILNIWNTYKNQIPEKNRHLQDVHTHTVAVLEGLNADPAKIKAARETQETLLRNLTPDATADWGQANPKTTTPEKPFALDTTQEFIPNL